MYIESQMIGWSKNCASGHRYLQDSQEDQTLDGKTIKKKI